MKSILHLLFGVFLQLGIASAAPHGIYLYAIDGKTAPADKVICLEFDRVQREGTNYRFYDSGGRSSLISDFKFRTMIYYDDAVGVENPDFEKRLKVYEETLRTYPASRRFLEQRTLKMKRESDDLAAKTEARGKLPKLTVGDRVFLGPKFSGFQGGMMFIKHADGGNWLKLDDFSDLNLEELKRIDPSAAGITTLRIGGVRLWNPRVKGLSGGCVIIENEGDPLKLDLDGISALDLKKVSEMNPSLVLKTVTVAGVKLWNPAFGGISNSKVTIRHEKGAMQLDLDTLTDRDRQTIMSWSDNTWTLSKPGLYKPADDGLFYGEIVFPDGRVDTGVSLLGRKEEEILVKTSHRTVPFSAAAIQSMEGLSSRDKDRLEVWIREMIQERFENAKPEVTKDVMAFAPAPDDGSILQAGGRIQAFKDGGILVSGLSGKRLKGRQTVRSTACVTVKHPVTGQSISKLTGTSEAQQEVVQDIQEDICFVNISLKKARVGQPFRRDRLKLNGKYPYSTSFEAPGEINSYSAGE